MRLRNRSTESRTPGSSGALALGPSDDPEVPLPRDGLGFAVPADESFVRPFFEAPTYLSYGSCVVGIATIRLAPYRGYEAARAQTLPDLIRGDDSAPVAGEISKNELIRGAVGVDGSGELNSRHNLDSFDPPSYTRA
jgi:hypothetical protein